MKEEDNINQLFRDVFENLEVTPPVSVKMGVDKELGPKKKFRFIFWWLPVLVLLLTGVVFAVVHYRSAAKQPVSTALQANSKSAHEDKSQAGDPSESLKSASEIERNSTDKGQADRESRLTETGKKALSSDANDPSLNAQERKQQRVQWRRGKDQQEARLLPAENPNRKSSIKQSGPVATPKKQVTKSRFRMKNSLRSTKNTTKKTGGKSGASEADENGKAPVGTFGNTSTEISETGKTPDATEKTGSAAGTTEKEPKDTEKGDSVQKADSLAAAVPADSLPKPDEPSVKPPGKDSKAKNWMVELHGGPRFGKKTSQSDFALKEATSYQIGLGFSRKLNLGPLNYVTLDGEYGSGKESYRSEITTTTLHVIAIDSFPVLDSTQTDTIGYTYNTIYDTVTSTTQNNTNATIVRFAFGLRTEFNFNLGAGFGLAVIPGYYYSMSKFRFSDGTTGSSSSSQILLGLGVYYDWNRFRFRVGLDSRYELMSKNQHAFIDKRKSMLFSPQFGIAVKF